jgi:catechol 2,3-dioxygenase
MLGVYIDVPNYLDGNGIELYRDRAEDEWPRADDGDGDDDGVAMVNAPLDLQALLSEAAS